MDYRTHLYSPLSKRIIDVLVDEIFLKPQDFQTVYRLIFDDEIKVAWRAAWACQKISEKKADWFSETNFNELVDLAMLTKQGGLQRGCLSILNNLNMPGNLNVEFINSCFEWMLSPKYPIAVQALSMKLLYKICQVEPDFIPEFRAYLENANPDDYTAGFQSTRKNILKRLNDN